MKAIVNPPGMKRCARCQETKPVSEYNKARNRRDGLRPYCKECRRAESAAWRARNPGYLGAYYIVNREAMLQAQKERRHTDPEWRAEQVARSAAAYVQYRDQRLEQQREYRLANPDKLRERGKAYRARVAADPKRRRRAQARMSAFNLAAYAADPERYREYARQRRARKRAVTIGRVTPALLSRKWSYWGGRCWMCGGEAEEFDHVKPLAKGGAHMLGHLRPACRACNARKSDTWPLPADF